jgi:hypothetical protein
LYTGTTTLIGADTTGNCTSGASPRGSFAAANERERSPDHGAPRARRKEREDVQTRAHDALALAHRHGRESAREE